MQTRSYVRHQTCIQTRRHAPIPVQRTDDSASGLDAILSHLPVGTAEGRAWSMRLAASILELAVFGFDQVDIGEASRQSWRGGPSPALRRVHASLADLPWMHCCCI